MKKALFLAMGLSSMITFAQDYKGRVGINTDQPKATLDIQPNATNLAGTTNEGIIAPKLTKKRVADITYSSPQDIKNAEGTLVYITETDYTQENSTNPTEKDKRVEEITQKGYHFFNGEKWVKAYNQEGLWSTRIKENITETYLKTADSNNDEFVYSKNRNYIRLGDVEQYVGADGSIQPINTLIYDTPHSINIGSSLLPKKENVQGAFANYYPIFSRENYQVIDTFTPTSNESPKFRGKDIILNIYKYTKPVSYAIGQNAVVDFISSTTSGDITAFRGFANVGDIAGQTSPNVLATIGVTAVANIYSGQSNSLIGITNRPIAYGGKINNLYGEHSMVATSDKLPKSSNYPTMNIENVNGNRISVTNKSLTTTKNLYGVLANTTFDASSSLTNDAGGFAHSAYIKANSNVKNFTGIYTYLDVDGAVTMDNYYAFRFANKLNTTFQPTNMYGLYLGDVKQGATLNYAIYTNAGKVRFGDNVGIGVDAPTQKLEVAGKIKASNVIFTGIPTYADDVTAGTGGLVAGEMYKTSTGELRIKL